MGSTTASARPVRRQITFVPAEPELVSHRFSTVRMADLIVVLDGGRVAEIGTHTQLLGAGGRYAELFSMQARAYR